jgi:hypothetical protein
VPLDANIYVEFLIINVTYEYTLISSSTSDNVYRKVSNPQGVDKIQFSKSGKRLVLIEYMAVTIL